MQIKTAAVLIFLGSIIMATAQGTAFTYQGQLTASGAPANGAYDLRFTIYDASMNGNIVGGPLTNAPTTVSNGLFTVQLDFGSNVFNGNPLWLQIGARTNGNADPYFVLAPLQPVTPTPYAIFAPNAGTAQTAASASSVSAANINGTVALAQLPVNVLTNNATGISLTGTFSGDGSGLANLNGSQISSGTINSSQLPTNAVVFNQVTLATNVYSQSGTYSLTVPPGVTQIIAKLWGAGGGATFGYYGGGGAFVQKTLAVTGGQTYVLVVGQRGDSSNNDLGGNGSGNAQGGSSMNFQGIGGGQGGQGSSLFYYSGSAYIMEAVAGAGGGAGVDENGAPGGNGGGAAGISYGTPAASGNNGIGGTGGSSTYASLGEGANGSSGNNYSTTATTTGVSSLSLANGDGGNCGNSSGVAGPSGAFIPNGGGGGGGYGGGGGGSMTILASYSASAGGGGGGGSYGDIVTAGNSKTPGNIGDPNYVNSAGYGGTSGSAGSDGLIVLIFQGAVANVPATVVANVLTAGNVTTTNLTASSLTTSNLQVNGIITGSNGVSGVLGYTSPTNGVALSWNGGSVAVPGTLSAGTLTVNKATITNLNVPGSESAGTLNVSGTTSSGSLSVSGSASAGTLNVSSSIYTAGSVTGGLYFATGAGAQYNFYDRTSFATYGQWSYYATAGKAYFWNSVLNSGNGENLMSIDSSGNVRAAGSFIANTTPDLAETIPAAKNVEAGDVVCADPQHPESIVRCDRDSQGVMGVISDGTSGFIINAHGKSVDASLTGKPLVLVGRVPVKVSLENGPIKIGDELAPSSTPGVAMRANGIGTVIGVALAPFDAEHQESWGQTGKVLCFVKVGEANSAAEIKKLQSENTDLSDRLQRLEKIVQSLEGKQPIQSGP